jgi:hypothetical protein
MLALQHFLMPKIHEPADGAIMRMSSAIMPVVLLLIMPCNNFFSMGNQANLLSSHLLLAIEPPINQLFCW